MRRRVLIGLSFTLASCCVSFGDDAARSEPPRPPAAQADAPDAPLALWYRRPAVRWLEALPLGNGRLGAMVYGGVGQERLGLNESTFWSGAPGTSHENPEGAKHLDAIRKLFFAGKYREGADQTARYLLGRTGNYGTHLPLGDLYLTMRHRGPEVCGYRRWLDLDQAVARTEYAIDGVAFAREVLCSHPDGVLAMHLSADRPGMVSFALQFRGGDRPWKAEARANDTLAIAGDARETMHSDGKTGVSFRGLVRVQCDGGAVTAVKDGLEVTGADAVTLFVAVNTTYQGRDPAARCLQQIAAIAKKSYGEVRAAHVADCQPLFRRVSLDLANPPAQVMPTDERLARVRRGEDDPHLAALFFQYGRYLLIAGSRGDSPLPLNLQGMWNDNLACNMGWTCDFHLDINTQQNYWPAEVCNLSECHEPLFRLIQSLCEPGRRTARVVYGCNGWVCHVVTNAWGYTAPGWGLGWGTHPTGGLWIASHLWDHYAFTGDRQFLAKRAYPVLREAAQFFLEYMVEHPKYGYLLTGPATSPENAFQAPDGSVVSESMGPTHDRVLVYDLFTHCIEATKILNIDEEFRLRLERARAKLPPLQIGRLGQLQEWLEDFPEAVPNHRHTSHLVALYPSSQITRRDTPELAKAARVTIERRLGQPNWEDVEWSRANMINYFARLGDADRAYGCVLGLIGKLSDTNLLTFSTAGIAGAQDNIFCVDGNSAGTAGIAEMLLQSHAGEIELVPALPKSWPTGSVRGLRARGGFEVDIAWSEGKLTHAAVRSKTAGACTIRYGDRTAQATTVPGRAMRLNGSLTTAE